MGLFDQNIHHPIEELYDQCKEVVEWIVPMNMMHYNGGCDTMKHDIEQMLRERNLFAPKYIPFNAERDVNKISEVGVSYGECIRGIPTYKVLFYYIKKIDSDLWYGGSAIQYGAYLTQFTVGISGIINESVQQ